MWWGLGSESLAASHPLRRPYVPQLASPAPERAAPSCCSARDFPTLPGLLGHRGMGTRDSARRMQCPSPARSLCVPKGPQERRAERSLGRAPPRPPPAPCVLGRAGVGNVPALGCARLVCPCAQPQNNRVCESHGEEVKSSPCTVPRTQKHLAGPSLPLSKHFMEEGSKKQRDGCNAKQKRPCAPRSECTHPAPPPRLPHSCSAEGEGSSSCSCRGGSKRCAPHLGCLRHQGGAMGRPQLGAQQQGGGSRQLRARS